MGIDLKRDFVTTNRIHSQFRVITNMVTLAQQMYHEGRISADEAGALVLKSFDPDLVSTETDLDLKYGGVMPLMSETARRQCMRFKMAPTEKPK